MYIAEFRGQPAYRGNLLFNLHDLLFNVHCNIKLFIVLDFYYNCPIKQLWTQWLFVTKYS